MIHFRNIFFAGGTIPASPLPEAVVRYADFPTLCEYNWDFWHNFNLHFTPLMTGGGIYPPPERAKYATVKKLGLDGCWLQGGNFHYDTAGPAGRTLKLRNTIFERVAVDIQNSGWYAYETQTTPADAEVTVVNNLFRQCYFNLDPDRTEPPYPPWTFTDNIFDNALTWGLMGPVAVNHHNAYIAMTGNHLEPVQNPGSDPDLPVLNYETGPLGRFYLPANANSLLGMGSRTAGQAGLYHFASRTTNAKQASGTVNIGPAYLGLDANGIPFDSNTGGPDGVADFLADQNGDGVEDADETSWQSPNSGALSVLAPTGGPAVSGIMQIRFSLPASSSAIDSVYPLVDGRVSPSALGIAKPGQSISCLEVDTRYLEDGQHSLSVGSYSESANDGSQTQSSEPVTFSTANQIRYPEWERQVDQLLQARVKAPSTEPDYTLWFFNSLYPKAYDPFDPSVNTSHRDGTSSAGSLSFSEGPESLGYGNGNTDASLFSFTVFSPIPGHVTVNPNHSQGPPYPDLGCWAATYTDDSIDFQYVPESPVADKYSNSVNPITQDSNDLWLHGRMLDHGWKLCGHYASAGEGETYTFPPHPVFLAAPQTWPLREGAYGYQTRYRSADRKLLVQIMMLAQVRNFYAHAHGDPNKFCGIDSGEWSLITKDRRFRFVFLDGCETAAGRLFYSFGAQLMEMQYPVYPPSDFQPPPAPQITMDYYTGNTRPSAFLGWKYTARYKYSVAGTKDDRTGREGCPMECYAAMANWHSQFLAAWIMQNRGVLGAIRYASDMAMSPGSDPPYRSDVMTEIAPDQLIPFDPGTCLRVYGYGDLHFNGYNHASDWP
jgi:hypothetical protein